MFGRMMISPIWNRPPRIEDQPAAGAAPAQTTAPAPSPRATSPKAKRFDLLLYMLNAIYAFLSALLDNNSISFESWWVRSVLLGWIASLMFITMRKPTLFHVRGLRMIMIATVLFIFAVVSFGLKQTYSVLPIIIDFGIVLACQDLPEDTSSPQNPLLPQQARDLNQGPDAV